MTEAKLGFIGLGVMGEPMCTHLVRKSGRRMLGYDLADAPFDRLQRLGLTRATRLSEFATTCNIIFLALPSGAHVEQVCAGEGGLLASARSGQIVVDLGTTSVATTRRLSSQFAKRA